MLRVQLVKSLKAATTFLVDCKLQSWVAIETEYGKATLDESNPKVDLALNHHGDFQIKDAPSMVYKNMPNQAYDNFLVSHIDLDVLFGILWTAGWLKNTFITKKLAGIISFADINGFHRIGEILKKEPNDIIDRYYAIGYLVNSWTINDNGLDSKDISKEVHKLLLRIKDIIMKGASEEQIALYKQWLNQKEETSKKYIQTIWNLCEDSHVFIYRAPFSLTTAYNLGDLHADIIIQYNEQSKSISLSCYNKDIAIRYFGDKGVITPLQLFFGKEAGGKLEIGGTPRNFNTEPEILGAFQEFLLREFFNVPEIIDLNKGENDVSNYSD